MGDDKVTFKLTHLHGLPTKVTFDGLVAKVVAATAKSVTVITPAHNEGVVDIVIANANCSVTLSKGFIYRKIVARD